MKQVKPLPNPNLNAKFSPELLGQAIRAKRTQSKLKLSEAAALCGVAKQTLSNIEKGSHTSQLNTITQVCAGLGLQLYIKPWPEE